MAIDFKKGFAYPSENTPDSRLKYGVGVGMGALQLTGQVVSSLQSNQKELDKVEVPGVDASSQRNLANMIAGTDKFDFGRENVGISTLKGAASGAAAGMVAGPIGAAIGGVLGGAASLIGGSMRNKNAERAEKKKTSQLLQAFGSEGANLTEQSINDSLVNYAALGGNLFRSGGDFETGLTEFNIGGSHEENPNGGILQGIGPNGKPNLVEEGEVKVDNFIFSDRILADKDFLLGTDLPKLSAKKSYAKLAKVINKERKERPNDPISKRTSNVLLGRLQQAQESQKAFNEFEQDFNSVATELGIGDNIMAKGGKINIKPNSESIFAKARQANANYFPDGGEGPIFMPKSLKKKGYQYNSPISQTFGTESSPFNEVLNGAVGTATPIAGLATAFITKNPAPLIAGAAGLGYNFLDAVSRNKANQVGTGLPKRLEDSAPLVSPYLTGLVANSQSSNTQSPTKNSNSVGTKSKSTQAITKKADSALQGYDIKPVNNTTKIGTIGHTKELLQNNIQNSLQASTDRASQSMKKYLQGPPQSQVGNGVDYSELGLFAPALGNLGNLLGVAASTPDTVNIPRISAGERLNTQFAYKPMDTEYMASQLRGQSGATRRSIMNTSGGNRGAAMAGLIATDQNYLGALGDSYIKAQEYNNNQLTRNQQLSNQAKQVNASMSLQESQYNSAASAQEQQLNSANRAAKRNAIREGIMALTNNVADTSRYLQDSKTIKNMYNLYTRHGEHNKPTK